MLSLQENFFTSRQSDYLVKTYSKTFISYINDTYSFEGCDINLLREAWLRELLLSQKMIEHAGQVDILRLQRLSAGFEVVDEHHVHTDPFSLVCFLNDDFTGGEFIYQNEQQDEVMIVPQKNTSLFFSGDVPHKVNKVLTGSRFTLVGFFDAP